MPNFFQTDARAAKRRRYQETTNLLSSTRILAPSAKEVTYGTF